MGALKSTFLLVVISTALKNYNKLDLSGLNEFVIRFAELSKMMQPISENTRNLATLISEALESSVESANKSAEKSANKSSENSDENVGNLTKRQAQILFLMEEGKKVLLMLPEERAREKIDKQLSNAGWNIVSSDEYVPRTASAVKEALMKDNTESDYLLFIDDKAIAVVEAKREENPLGAEVEKQAEDYANSPQDWYGLWYQDIIPLVYMANGNKIYFKNLLKDQNADYIEISEMHSPKKMLSMINKTSEFGALLKLDKRGLRECQYNAEIEFEKSMKEGKNKNLAVLATGSGKTYLACLASYRMLNYTPVKRVLFLVDRNNLARQTEAEYSQFDRTEGQTEMSSLYEIKRLKKESDIKADIVISTIQKLYAVLTGQSLSDINEDAEDESTTTVEEKNEKELVTLGADLMIGDVVYIDGSSLGAVPSVVDSFYVELGNYTMNQVQGELKNICKKYDIEYEMLNSDFVFA